MKILVLTLGVFVAAMFGVESSASACGFKLIDAPRGPTLRDVSRPRAARSAGPRRAPVRSGPVKPVREPVETGPTEPAAAEPAPTPEPAAEPAQPEPTPEKPAAEPAPGKPTKANFGKEVFFDLNSSEVNGAGKAKLKKVAKWMKANPNASVTVEGHTSTVGSPEYNKVLGERRAQAAKDFLVEEGVDASRVEVVSFGVERPAYEPGSSGKNRRISIVVGK